MFLIVSSQSLVNVGSSLYITISFSVILSPVGVLPLVMAFFRDSRCEEALSGSSVSSTYSSFNCSVRLRILLSSEVLLNGFIWFVLRGPMYWVRSPSVAKSSSSLSSWCFPHLDGTGSVEAHFQFKLVSEHISGSSNNQADYLSRNQITLFNASHKTAKSLPSHVDSSLIQWLLHPQLDWTSPTWTHQFSSFVQRQ